METEEMKTSSAKAKGRRCAQEAVDVMKAGFRAIGKPIKVDEFAIASAGQTGEDIQLSPAIRERLPFNIECKNTERLNLWAAWEQAKGHGEYTPLLVFKKNRSELLCCLRFEDLIALILKSE